MADEDRGALPHTPVNPFFEKKGLTIPKKLWGNK
jgi:hypothetical protein